MLARPSRVAWPKRRTMDETQQVASGVNYFGTLLSLFTKKTRKKDLSSLVASDTIFRESYYIQVTSCQRELWKVSAHSHQEISSWIEKIGRMKVNVRAA